jgi:hypothetical protein
MRLLNKEQLEAIKNQKIIALQTVHTILTVCTLSEILSNKHLTEAVFGSD